MKAFHFTVAVGLILSLTACADSEESAAVTEDRKIFLGTPAEYTVLMRACLEEGGIRTGDDPGGDKTIYLSDLSAMDEDAYFAVQLACYNQIGEPKITGLSEEELLVRFDERVTQWDCLVLNGLQSGDPISFDVFVDQYQRSGQKELWEPTFGSVVADASGNPYNPSGMCPRDSGVW